MTSCLEFQTVSFRYGTSAVVRDLSFSVAAGEAVALLGLNGSGKTTVTKLATGLLRPVDGVIRVCGQSIRTRPPERVARDGAYVFQHPDDQVFSRTVRDEVGFGPAQLGVPHERARGIVEAALARVGLSGVQDHHPYDLPLPLRKLVTVASAIAQQPRLLVLDEPVQGLDRRHRGIMLGVLQGLIAEGHAVLMATHDLEFAAEVCDRGLLLTMGTGARAMPMEDLIRDPALLEDVGLRLPPASHVSRALRLPGAPYRWHSVIAAVQARLRTSER